MSEEVGESYETSYPEDPDLDKLDPDDSYDPCDYSGHFWEYIGNGCYVCEICGQEDCDY